MGVEHRGSRLAVTREDHSHVGVADELVRDGLGLFHVVRDEGDLLTLRLGAIDVEFAVDGLPDGVNGFRARVDSFASQVSTPTILPFFQVTLM